MPFETSVDPYLQRLATPRKGLRVDDIAVDAQDKINASNAAIAALRSNPLQQALAQDTDAKVALDDYIGEGTTGEYSPFTNRATVKVGRDKDRVQNTLYHELIHSLQQKRQLADKVGADWPPKDRGRYAQNTLAVLDQGNTFRNTNEEVGFGETPKKFMQTLDSSGLMYGGGEPAAFLTSQLLQGTPITDDRVKQVFDQFPILSTMYAQANNQPNRAAPRHYKGYPEMSMLERRAFDKGDEPPVIDKDQRVAGAATMAQIIALRNARKLP